MPIYLDKRNGRLYIEFQFRGVRHKERLPASIKRAEAESIEIRLKNDLLMQSHGIANAALSQLSYIPTMLKAS